jgi:hypothetical protein
MTNLLKIEGTTFNFKKLKKLYKLPMVMIAILGSLVGGFTNTLMKTCTLKYDIDGGFSPSLGVLTFLAWFVALCQILILNKAMEFYD